jgi:hypothetical protein
MARMKDLSISLGNLGFDVDGSVTLAMVSRAVPGETSEARMRRLAAKALIAGCRLVAVDTDARWTDRIGVTSGSTAGLVYIVTLDPDRPSCTCQAIGLCCHQSFALAMLGLLPSPEPPALPAAARLLADPATVAALVDLLDGVDWLYESPEAERAGKALRAALGEER